MYLNQWIYYCLQCGFSECQNHFGSSDKVHRNSCSESIMVTELSRPNSTNHLGLNKEVTQRVAMWSVR